MKTSKISNNFYVFAFICIVFTILFSGCFEKEVQKFTVQRLSDEVVSEEKEEEAGIELGEMYLTNRIHSAEYINNKFDTKADKKELSDVAFSGSYDDLEDRPTIPEVQIQSDWNENNSSKLSFIKNKPEIPIVNDGILSISVNNDTVQTFTANQSGNTSINLSIPDAQVQSDWAETDDDVMSYIQNKPDIAEIVRGVVNDMAITGWEVNGTYYKLVVQTFVPPPAETTFTLDDGTEEVVDISGTLNQQWMIEHGYFDENNDEWLKIITQVEIGTNVTEIGVCVFEGCRGLTSVMIPNSVTRIKYWAFRSCSDLTNVTIPDSVMSIEQWAFQGCSSLASVTIPNSVTSIGNDAFYGCSNLTTVNYILQPDESEEDGLIRIQLLMTGKGINLSQIQNWNPIPAP